MQLIKIANSEITTKNNKIIHNDKVKLTSASGIAVYGANNNPEYTPPVADTDEREGWLFHKSNEGSDKFNYYLYSNTSSSHPWTLGDLKSAYMTCAIDTYSGLSSAPFIVVYTVMTGSGDSGAWYKSKRAYALNTSNNKILGGEHINLYSNGHKPDFKNDYRSIPLETIIDTGTCDDSEQILTISYQSDSGSPMNTKILVSDAGYNLGNEIKRHIKLIA